MTCHTDIKISSDGCHFRITYINLFFNLYFLLMNDGDAEFWEILLCGCVTCKNVTYVVPDSVQ